MFNKNKVIAFVPARAGSKGLPNKNILDCAGKPLIAWTIEAAQRSQYIDDVVVSTDCKEIANIAEKYNAHIPFIRPKNLAEDDSNINDVLKHFIYSDKHTLILDNTTIILLQPTSPLRNEIHIDLAIEYYFAKRKSELDTLVSVSKVCKKLNWVMSEVDGYGCFILDIDTNNIRRQVNKNLYIPNGAIYILNAKNFHAIYTKNTLMYELDEIIGIDIDDINDFNMAANALVKRKVTSCL